MTKEELIKQIENGDFHLSFSALSSFAESPQHFVKYKLQKKEPTPAMIFGNYIHTLVLQPDEVDKKFVIQPEIDKRTKVGKEQFQEFVDNLNGRLFISKEDAELGDRMKNAIYWNDASKPIIDAVTETEKEFNIVVKGFKIKGFKDGVGDNLILELKTNKEANPFSFQREIMARRYYLQGGIYTIDEQKDFYWVAIDKELGVSVHKASQKLLQYGRVRLEYLLHHFNRCIINNCWGMSYDFWPDDGIYQMHTPTWFEQETNNLNL